MHHHDTRGPKWTHRGLQWACAPAGTSGPASPEVPTGPLIMIMMLMITNMMMMMMCDQAHRGLQGLARDGANEALVTDDT